MQVSVTNVRDMLKFFHTEYLPSCAKYKPVEFFKFFCTLLHKLQTSVVHLERKKKIPLIDKSSGAAVTLSAVMRTRGVGGIGRARTAAVVSRPS